jgi:very-short-patch-repair endonuclease
MAKRSIGVISLLADEQAYEIWKALEKELGIEVIQRHQIACGDPWSFQGKERDIMFLSMVVCPKSATAITRRAFAQRFNVAASRARDRMYLIRSVSTEDLSEADYLRRSLIKHFVTPFVLDDRQVAKLRELCESTFEKEIYDILTQRGYAVLPQVAAGGYRIDMVVEGQNGKRLAIECDGDRFHGPEQWEDDMRRQRILERAGWTFWRCFASAFVLNRSQVIQDLLDTLNIQNISPVQEAQTTTCTYTENRIFTAFPKSGSTT